MIHESFIWKKTKVSVGYIEKAWPFILTIQESEDKGIGINEWLIFGQKNSPQKVHVIVLNWIFNLVTLIKL
jgi:hypothetical protein